MIVRNEREHLPRCLDSVCGLVDDIVIVDTGSTDGTQSIAKEHGARLIQSEWKQDFSAARNESLAQARGRWILVLDADELLLDQDRERVRGLLDENGSRNGGAPAAFNLIQKSSSDGGKTGIAAYVVRLFPNLPEVRYRWPIHEQIVPSLMDALIPIINTDAVILHTGYSDPRRNREKQKRNLAILEKQIAAGKEVSALTYFLSAGCHLDLGDPAAALQLYEQSWQLGRATVGQEEMAEGARVRMVECLVALNRFEEAIERSGGSLDHHSHPELLVYRAQAEGGAGRPEDARATLEMIFSCPDGPRVPAYDSVRVKIEALRWLGEYWRGKGNPTRGICLLRAAVALKREPCEFAAADLRRLYESG